MIREFYEGVSYYPRAHGLIRRHGLWWWLPVPGILSLLYISLLFLAGRRFVPPLAAYLFQEWMPGFLQFESLAVATTAVLGILFLATAWVVLQPVILTVFSPFLSLLSEMVEKRHTGREMPPFRASRLLGDLVRAARINLRILCRLVIFCAASWLLVFVPLVGPAVSGALIFCIQGYYTGFSLSDYSLERHMISVSESVGFIRRNRWRVVGVGAGFLLLMLVPGLGWFFAPVYGAAAATLFVIETRESGDAERMPGQKHIME